MAYGTATLTGTYKTFDDQPASGVVEIIPNSRSLVDAEGDVILAGRVKVALDETGSFTVALPATDDTTVEPATGRQYTVVAKLRHTHLPAVTGVELTTGATVDVSDVAAQPETDALVTPAATVAQLDALEAETATALALKADAADIPTTPQAVGAEPAGLSAETEAALSATHAPRTALVSDLPAVWYIGHMGALALYPEDTMEGIRAAVATDCDAVEFDVHLLADGSLGVMHDGTVNRVTTSTGNVSDHTAGSWQQLTLDAGSWLGGGWGNLKAPLFTQVLDEFGGKKVLVVELKSAGTGTPALAEIAKRGLEKSVVAISAFWNELTPFAAEGIPCYYIAGTAAPDTAALLAAGYDVAIDINSPDSNFTSAVAAGLKVMGYRTTRRRDRDRCNALGVTAHITDDPVYTRGDLDKSTDPFAAQTWFPGMLVGNAGVRGTFTAPDEWGFAEATNAGARTVLQGYICPDDTAIYNPATDTIKYAFDLVFQAAVDTGRWGGVYFGFANDVDVNDGAPLRTDADGYRALITPTGLMHLALYNDGVTGAALTSATGTALVLPQTVPLELTVTPTSITWKRTDTGFSVTSNDATRRGPYVHFGTAGATVRFKNVVRTITKP